MQTKSNSMRFRVFKMDAKLRKRIRGIKKNSFVSSDQSALKRKLPSPFVIKTAI